MFVGRERELATLFECYSSNRFECVIIYGRRRIGKTELINEFVRDRRSIFFTGVDTTGDENLKYLSQSIFQCIHPDDTPPVYESYENALDAIGVIAKEEKIVVVFDEYPYLAKSYPAISSLLQKQIDTDYQYNPNMMLILCGSSMSFMSHQVLGYESPLYGRRTSQIFLKPFSFFEMQSYYKSYTPEDKFLMYAVSGGIPKYFTLMDEGLTSAENITKQFFSTSGYLYEEPENLLKQELREPAVYNAILRAISSGKNKSGEIASALNISTSKIVPYLTKLMELHIIKKITPVPYSKSKKTVYDTTDSMFRFWYSTVPSVNNLISRGFSDRAYQHALPSIETFMGKAFEEICTDYLWLCYDRLPVAFTDIGRWWGTNPTLHCKEEIDIVAIGGDAAVFCECKWINHEVGADEIATLIRRSLLIDVEERHYIIFAKRSFSDACILAAKTEGVLLVTFEDMMSGVL